MIELGFFLLFIMAGTTQQSPFAVAEDPLFGSPDQIFVVCEDSQIDPLASTTGEQSRIDGFILTGTSHCERLVFEYGERDSFVDYVTLHVESRAKNVAQTLKARLVGKNKPFAQGIVIDVDSDRPALSHFVKMAFINEFREVFGVEIPLYRSKEDPHVLFVKIQVKRLQDPQGCLEVRLGTTDSRGGIQWAAL